MDASMEPHDQHELPGATTMSMSTPPVNMPSTRRTMSAIEQLKRERQWMKEEFDATMAEIAAARHRAMEHNRLFFEAAKKQIDVEHAAEVAQIKREREADAAYGARRKQAALEAQTLKQEIADLKRQIAEEDAAFEQKEAELLEFISENLAGIVAARKKE